MSDNPHSFGEDLMTNLTPEMVFDFVGVRLEREALKDEDFTVRFELSDTGENYMVYMRYGALLHAKETADASVVVKCSSRMLLLLASGNGEKFKQVAKITGDAPKLEKILNSLHRFKAGALGDFNIVEP